MRYLKIYENYQTEEEVSKICEKYGITNWSINQDGLVDVNGDVDLERKGLTKLPLKFGMVTGIFNCTDNKLTTLEGAPRSVDGRFSCGVNKLTTLEGAPRSVGGHFYCYRNQLTTLEGAPESVSGGFYCALNELTTLEGAPRSVDGFACNNNNLITLEGAPESVDGDFNCDHNRLTTLEGAPYSVGGGFYFFNNPLPDLIQKNIKWINHILANQEMYHIYNKDGTINEYRFGLMMDSMD